MFFFFLFFLCFGFLFVSFSSFLRPSDITTTADELFQGYPPALLHLASATCIVFILVGVPGNLITIIALARCKKVSSFYIYAQLHIVVHALAHTLKLALMPKRQQYTKKKKKYCSVLAHSIDTTSVITLSWKQNGTVIFKIAADREYSLTRVWAMALCCPSHRRRSEKKNGTFSCLSLPVSAQMGFSALKNLIYRRRRLD